MLHFMAQKPTSLFYYSTNHVGRQEKLDNGIYLAESIRTQKEAVCPTAPPKVKLFSLYAFKVVPSIGFHNAGSREENRRFFFRAY